MWGKAAVRGDTPVPPTNERSCAARANVVHLAATICLLALIIGFSDAAPVAIAVRADETAKPIPKVFPRVPLCKGSHDGWFY